MPTKEEILAAFEFRHACKQFNPSKKIPPDDFTFILEAGRLSPSSFGFEPWRFVVLQNPELRAQLMLVVWGSQGHLPTASHYLAILCRKADMRFDSTFIDRFMRDVQHLPEESVQRKRERFRIFQENDLKLLESQRTLFDWSCKQAYIALGNMMTAAALIGVDSCAVEGYDLEATEKILADAGVLDPSRFGLAVMAAFGYRINPPPTKTRQTLKEVVTWVE